MKPAFTRYDRPDPDAVPSAFAVPIEEIREEIGIFDDTSMNDLLIEQILTAEEICTKALGRPVLERGVTDFYKGGYSFDLSCPAIAGDAFTVSYWADTKRTRTVTGAVLDKTKRFPAVHVPSGTYPTWSMKENPWMIAYRGGMILEDKGWPVVRQAVKAYVGQFFFNRGRGDAEIDLKPIAAMLMPYRTEGF